MPHKPVYPKLKEGYAINAFSHRNGEGCVFQTVALGMSLRVLHPFSTIPTRSSTHDALIKRFMVNSKNKSLGRTEYEGLSGDEGLKDILRVLMNKARFRKIVHSPESNSGRDACMKLIAHPFLCL